MTTLDDPESAKASPSVPLEMTADDFISRPDLIRHSCASAYSIVATPEEAMRADSIHLFPELIVENGIKQFIDNFNPNTDQIWLVEFPGAERLEFVLNQSGEQWDKPSDGGNYLIQGAGRYLLRLGRIQTIIPPPGRPAVLEASKITASTVSLMWNGPMVRPLDISGYQIFRDGVQIGSTDPKTCQFEDPGLSALTQYVYVVKAVNKNGMTGLPSDPLNVTTGQRFKPSQIQNLRISKHTEKSIEISWRSPHDSGGEMLAVYRIYRNGVPIASVSVTSNEWETWTDTKVKPKMNYTYHVTACRHLRIDEGGSIEDISSLPSTFSRLPSMLGSPPKSKDVGTLTKYLSDIIQKKDYEGLVAMGVEVKTVAQSEAPRLDDKKTHLILQGFDWHSWENPKGWFSTLEEKIEGMMSSGITMVWLPPPSSSVAPEGYLPTRWHDLNTKYGNRDDLRHLIGELKGSGITPMLDLVINHRCGVRQDDEGQWTIFEDPDWGSWAIVSNNLVGYVGQGAPDTGSSIACAPDIDHMNDRVRADIKSWMGMLFNDVGFGALRLDMAAGYSPKYQVEYVESVGNPFAVGEYWSGDVNDLNNYTKACRGRLASFDFALYYILRHAVESGNFSALNNGGKPPGLIGSNHDTVHLDSVGKFANWDHDAVIRGYVYLLTHPGTPALFLDHFFDFGEQFSLKLNELIRIRQCAELNSQSGIYIKEAQDGLYAAYISKDRFCDPTTAHIAVKLGRQDWCPQEENWEVKTFGNDYCVWTRIGSCENWMP